MLPHPDSTSHPRAITVARRLVGVTALVGVGTTLVLGLVVAPPDVVQGQAQRLMYVHVPAAVTAYLSFAIVLLASVGYLVRRDLRFDAAAQAGAEIGVGMTTLTIMLGMLWGKPVWGVWWVWDPRLVTTAVLLLIYVGYLGVRGLADDAHVNARRAAVVGIIGFIDVPIVHFSVLWWRTLHQPPTLLQPEQAPPLAAPMLAALLAGMVTFAALGAWVFLRRLDVLAGLSGPARPPGQRPPPSPSPTEPIRVRGRSRR